MKEKEGNMFTYMFSKNAQGLRKEMFLLVLDPAIPWNPERARRIPGWAGRRTADGQERRARHDP